MLYDKELPLPDQSMQLHDDLIKHYLFYKINRQDKSRIGICSKCGNYISTLELANLDDICPHCKCKLIPKKITERFNFLKHDQETAGELIRKEDGYIIYSYVIGFTRIHAVSKREQTTIREVERIYVSALPNQESYIAITIAQNHPSRKTEGFSKCGYADYEYGSGYFKLVRKKWIIQKPGFNTFKEFFADTAAKYTHLGDWMDSVDSYMDTKSIIAYYNSVIRWPYVEMLWKFGFHKLYGGVMNGSIDRRTIHKKSLIEYRKVLLEIGNPSPVAFENLVFCKKNNLKYKLEDLDNLTNSYYETVAKAMKLTKASQGKVERYLREILHCNDQPCHQAYSNYQPKTWWIDYLSMVEEIEGYVEGKKAFPMDLKKAHDDMVIIKTAMAAELQAKKIMREKPQLVIDFEKSICENQVANYEFQDQSGLMVVAIKSIRELVDEGALLKHCVGGIRYMTDIALGKSFIFSIRKADDIQKPLGTIEYSNGKIVQCYGYGSKEDTLPDNTKPMLERWKEHIRNEVVAYG